MKVFVDSTEVKCARPTLAAGLAAGAAHADSVRRVVIEVYADGSRLADEALAQPSDDPGLIGELRLTTADPRLLVQQTLLDASEALEQAAAEQHRTAELLQAGKTDQAVPVLQGIFVTWQAACDIIEKSSALLRLDLASVAIADPEHDRPLRADEQISELVAKLGEVKQALVSQDISALSDLLAYDLDNLAFRWQKLLRGLATAAIGGESTR